MAIFRILFGVFLALSLVSVSGCAYQMTSPFAPLVLRVQSGMEEKNVIFETEQWRIVLRKSQYYLGRTVVRLKRACGNIACVTQNERDELHSLMIVMQGAAREAFGADKMDFALLMNHAYRRKPPTPLVHWHLVPRYKNPIVFGGETFKDLRFGSNFRGEMRVVSDEMRERIIGAYRGAIQKIMQGK
jgi:diadenosine tetraphosphate (Ap4A) HIT family hydrolase